MWALDFESSHIIIIFATLKDKHMKQQGWQIMVHENREDPDDWTCQCHIDRDYVYDGKVYLDHDEAVAEMERLQKEKDHISYSPVDCGYLTYSLQTVTIQ